MVALLLSLFSYHTEVFQLPPNLLASICYQESKFNITALHKKDGKTDSIGVCQIKYETAKYMGFVGTKEELFNPEINIYYAAKYLRHQLMRYHYDIPKAVIAYNRGSAFSLTSTKYSVNVFNNWRTRKHE